MYSVRLIFLIFLSTSLNILYSQTNINSNFTVVIDPGHGGKDPGAVSNGYYEKIIALSTSLKLGRILEENNIDVVYTRNNDVFVNLIERANIANRSGAQLFLSIHCNAHSSQAYGAETFVLGLHANQRNFEVAKKENSVIFLEDDYINQYDGFDPSDPESVISLMVMQEDYL
ncbi:MAG: N-acetylmuramoyl-L-alanine amidase, partial [Bacteroidota bacterium]|nr:N-acetylmuramoyl-L-alanine amidase [Bacteroidota bacterium]